MIDSMNYPYYIVVTKDGELFDLPKRNIHTGCEIHAGRFCETLLPSGLTVFRSVDAIRCYLFSAGYDEKEINSMTYLRSVGTCSRCGSPLFPSLIKTYETQCFYCDEDFYGFEQLDMLDKCFDGLPKTGPLTKQQLQEGDTLFLDPGDAAPAVIEKVFDTPLEDGYSIITGYMSHDWAIYKNKKGQYAAFDKSATDAPVVHINASCPACGSIKWQEARDGEGAFVCRSCGQHYFPGEMVLQADII